MTTPAEQLRLEYRACISLADKTDSKAEDRRLRQEAGVILMRLRECCPHDYVVCTQAYAPSYSSYEDPTYEVRKCLVCDMDEYAEYYTYDFEDLKTRPIATFHDPPSEIEKPLIYMLTECLEVVETKGVPYRD